MKKKMIAVVLSLALIMSAASATPSMTAYAKTKSPKLSRKKIVMTVGKTQKVKLKNASQKVKWTVAKKQVVKITRKSGKYHNSITIKGLKAGSTKVTAKCGKKKYKVKVTVKKVATPSIPTTQSTTTKGMETITSKSAETTTSKIVATTTDKSVETTTSGEIEETTFQEEEITTTEENPESTTVEQTTVPETTMMESISEEPTVEGTTTEELTEENSTSEEQTEKLTTEEETTQEETTEPETTRETKLVAEVLNDGLTTDDTLQIKYYFDGPTDVVLWTNGNPQILEIYDDNQWIELEHKYEWIPPTGMGGLSQENPEILELPLSLIYKDVRPGHYRYTRTLGQHFTYNGENPFGDSISVEFDVSYPEFYITGQAKNEKIKITDNLEITYTIITENAEEYIVSKQPYDLYFWSEPVGLQTVWSREGFYGVTEREYETLAGSGLVNITISLKEYFETLPPGKYKYEHLIAGKYVGVTFEIVDEEEVN